MLSKQQLYGHLAPIHKPSKSDKQDLLHTAGKVKLNSKAMFSYGFVHMDTPVLANQQKFTSINFVQTMHTIDKSS